jgi:hypothetical protein
MMQKKTYELQHTKRGRNLSLFEVFLFVVNKLEDILEILFYFPPILSLQS